MNTVVWNRAALDELLHSPDGPVAKELQRRALRVEGAAKRLCPVDTGRLRSSITNQLGTDQGELLAVVGTDVEYAPYVELGTRHMSPQPFLRPAIEAAK